MKKLFLAGAIGISIAALAANQGTQKTSTSLKGKNHSLCAYRDGMAQNDTTPPKDTLPKKDSIGLR